MKELTAILFILFMFVLIECRECFQNGCIDVASLEFQVGSSISGTSY